MIVFVIVLMLLKPLEKADMAVCSTTTTPKMFSWGTNELQQSKSMHFLAGISRDADELC